MERARTTSHAIASNFGIILYCLSRPILYMTYFGSSFSLVALCQLGLYQGEKVGQVIHGDNGVFHCNAISRRQYLILLWGSSLEGAI